MESLSAPPTATGETDFDSALAGIVDRLMTEASKRVSRRANIERRWIVSLQQYYGRYDEKTETKLKERRRSELFANRTRQKCAAMESRISDMLFPTDDTNWAIKPTPVPTMVPEALNTALGRVQQRQQAQQAQQGQQAQQLPVVSESERRRRAVMEEAKIRCDAMREQMDDALKESQFALECREAIRDGVQLGIGIIKGPVLQERPPARWSHRDVEDEGEGEEGETHGEWGLGIGQDNRPMMYRVDPWAFFPSIDARTIEQSEGVFERHIMSRKDLRAMGRRPDYIADQVRAVLRSGVTDHTPQNLAALRSITDTQVDTGGDWYIVWEWHGPLTWHDLSSMAEALDQNQIMLGVDTDGEEDPLIEVEVTLWICQDRVLKIGLHPLDSDDPLYSTWSLDPDPSSMFGFGLPHIMRHPQSSLNAAWRMMMDNGGISSGPQVVVDHSAIEPMDAQWTLEPFKIWKAMPGANARGSPFQVFDIPSNQGELAGIIELSERFIDDETGLPPMVMGDGGQTVQQTAQGMMILQNYANVIFRRLIKSWDDRITVPTMRRLYDWLMQFSRDEAIKGDYEVVAKGSSTLLVREVQSANLMALVERMSVHPVYGPMTAHRSLSESLVRSMMLLPADVILTDDEIVAEQEKNPPEPPFELIKLEKEMEIKRLDLEFKRSQLDVQVLLANLSRDQAMIELAAKQNTTLDQIRGQLEGKRQDSEDKRLDREGKERMLVSEAAFEERQGNLGGSGGYL